jgi:hypothetical protein
VVPPQPLGAAPHPLDEAAQPPANRVPGSSVAELTAGALAAKRNAASAILAKSFFSINPPKIVGGF